MDLNKLKIAYNTLDLIEVKGIMNIKYMCGAMNTLEQVIKMCEDFLQEQQIEQEEK